MASTIYQDNQDFITVASGEQAVIGVRATIGPNPTPGEPAIAMAMHSSALVLGQVLGAVGIGGADNGAVTIAASGSVVAEDTGISGGGAFAVQNAGLIEGGNHGLSLGKDSVVANSGAIRATGEGGMAIRLTYGGTVVNDGIIEQRDGNTASIGIANMLDEFANVGTLTVVNGGTIRAGAGIIGFASLSLVNTGTIEGTSEVAVRSGRDAGIFNSGVIKGTVDLGEGRNLYDGRLGRVDGEVNTEGFSDTLLGGAGAERFKVRFGEHVIDGGAGKEADTLAFDTYDEDEDDYADLVVNLNRRDTQDTGNGIMTIRDIENVTADGGDDKITGSRADNHIRGMDGNDTLEGGTGNDTLDGGEGDDWVFFSGGVRAQVNLAVVEAQNTGQGRDVIRDIEHLSGGSGGDRFTGNDNENVLLGNNGNDLLDGKGGNDILAGGAGNDTLRGGEAEDVLSGGAGNDLIEGQGSAGDRLFGDAGNDTIRGGGGADRIDGGGGSDLLSGGAGNDTIYGKTDRDRIFGEGGDDYIELDDVGGDKIDGGEGEDTLSFEEMTAGLIVDLTTGTAALSGRPSNISTVRNIEVVEGGSGDDLLIGTAGSNRLYGSQGNDTLASGGGTDTLGGGAGFDVADLSAIGAALVFDGLSSVTYSLNGTSHTISFDKIEGVILGGGNDSITLAGEWRYASGGAGNDTLTGSEGDDTIAGGAGNDSLTGGDGTDTLDYSGATGNLVIELEFGTATGEGEDAISGFENVIGGAGDDSIIGSAADNVIAGGLGNDTLSGGGGYDTLDFSTVTGKLTVDLTKGEAKGQGTDTISGFEVVIGGFGSDTILGDDAINAFFGGAGNDSLSGAGGDDYLLGADGNDTLIGGSGADVLEGGAGRDLLIVDNGALADVLSGGAGADTFRFTTPSPVVLQHRITDFKIGEDKIDLSFLDGNVEAAGRQKITFAKGATDPAQFTRGEAFFNTTTGVLSLSIDGDNDVEFAIRFDNPAALAGLTSKDFIL